MKDKEKVKHFYEIVTSNHLIEALSEYIAVDCTVRNGENISLAGINGMKQHLIAVKGTYPDLKMTIICQYCDGDYVVSEFIAVGTHKGEWLGMKPTGKKLTFTGVNIDKVIDGKIVEHSGAMNTFETLFEENIIQPV